VLLQVLEKSYRALWRFIVTVVRNTPLGDDDRSLGREKPKLGIPNTWFLIRTLQSVRVGRVRDLVQWIVKLGRTGKFFCEFQATGRFFS
jgi:hypothetical protein